MKKDQKIIVFDFDGTLTTRDENVWLKFWQRLGYSTDKDSYCMQLFKAFRDRQIPFSKWCSLTADAFREGGLSMDLLIDVSKQTQFLNNLSSSLKRFSENGFLIFIATDNIKQFVHNALGENAKYIEEIFANEVTFDRNGILESIIGNNVEIGNKAKSIMAIFEKYNASPEDVIFVGNSYNDEGVRSTGCTTICVNPKKTDPNNKEFWSYNLGDFDNLLIINDFVDEIESKM